MSEKLKTVVPRGLAILAFAVGGSACGGNEIKNENLQVCEAQFPEGWMPPPADVPPEDIAATLGLPLEVTALNGIFGPAFCSKGITTQQIEQDDSVVSIPQFGGPCVVIGINTEEMPQDGERYTEVVAVCVPPKAV